MPESDQPDLEPIGDCGLDVGAYQTEARSCRTHGLVEHEYRDGEWQCRLCPSQEWSG